MKKCLLVFLPFLLWTMASAGAVETLVKRTTDNKVTSATSAEVAAVVAATYGTGVATFLTTPTSANLITAVTNETGTGALVFATSPTFVTPILGTPTSGVATNLTGTASGLTAGAATVLATARAIYGNNFDGSAALTQIIASTYGGTGNGFTKISGPTTAERTKTMRDASDTVLELGGSYTPTGTYTNMTFVTPILGTPQSGTLTNCTLPVGGVSGLGTNVATWLATPSSANLIAALTDETGTGAAVFANTPTLVTPVLGVATATSVNKVAITAPATSATLTIADGKTLTVNHSLTLAGTDSTTMTFPSTSATIARTDAANTFTGHQTIEGVTSTGATGTGKLVFDTAPQISAIELGHASANTLTASSGVLSIEGAALAFQNNSASFLLTAAGSWVPTTSGATAAAQVETSSNKVNYFRIAFADAATSYAEWAAPMPGNYNGGTITATFYWTGGSDTTTNAVMWGLQAGSFNDGTAIDTAYGTAVTVTDANASTANQVRVSAATSAITIAGSPAAGSYVQFRAERVGGDAADTLATTAYLIGVRITFTKND